MLCVALRSHDGRTLADGSTEGYYQGHNGWAPIMVGPAQGPARPSHFDQLPPSPRLQHLARVAARLVFKLLNARALHVQFPTTAHCTLLAAAPYAQGVGYYQQLSQWSKGEYAG